jgi:hypothetical protein
MDAGIRQQRAAATRDQLIAAGREAGSSPGRCCTPKEVSSWRDRSQVHKKNGLEGDDDLGAW